MMVKDELLNCLPDTTAWPIIAEVWQRGLEKSRLEWEMPLLAAHALGCDTREMMPAVASIACLQVSILLIDDMLDDDPRGLYREIGVGLASNLASIFQSLAIQVLEELPKSVQWSVATCIAEMGTATAMGQYMDVSIDMLASDPEDTYWTLAKAKSSPFFTGGLKIGGILAEAKAETIDQLAALGGLIGEAVQVADDLMDIMDDTPNPDWQTPHKNLLLLYAQLVDDPRTDELERLDVYNGDLETAQNILLEIDAVAYAVAMLKNYQSAAEAMLSKMNLVNPDSLYQFIRQYAPLITAFA